MQITAAEKAEIRKHWDYLKLRFKADGSVEAQQHAGGGWGVLYTPSALREHIGVLRRARAAPVRTYPITQEEAINRDKWFITLSKAVAVKYAGRKRVYQLPNGAYAVRKKM